MNYYQINLKLNNMNLLKIVTIIAIANVGFVFCSFAQNIKLSDAEIASVAVIANQIDIAYANIAKERSEDKDVLNFAQTMASDHTAVIAQATSLVKKLGITPMDNEVSKKLLEDAENIKKMLKSKNGKDFNKAYIENEVGYHKAVITTVKDLLIPETENKELKDLLQAILPALEAHLHHAEMIQKTYLNK